MWIVLLLDGVSTLQHRALSLIGFPTDLQFFLFFGHWLVFKFQMDHLVNFLFEFLFLDEEEVEDERFNEV